MYPSEPTLQASPTTLALYDALAPTLVDVRLSIRLRCPRARRECRQLRSLMTASTMRERLREVRDIGEVLAFSSSRTYGANAQTTPAPSSAQRSARPSPFTSERVRRAAPSNAAPAPSERSHTDAPVNPPPAVESLHRMPSALRSHTSGRPSPLRSARSSSPPPACLGPRRTAAALRTEGPARRTRSREPRAGGRARSRGRGRSASRRGPRGREEDDPVTCRLDGSRYRAATTAA